MKRKNVFVVGLDDFNRQKLERLPHAADCDFHAALDIADIRGVDRFDMQQLIDKATSAVLGSGVQPDAVVAYYDFPATDLVPILAERCGLRGPTLAAVLKCEHKYWSRLEQQKTAAAHIPRFFAFDPFDERSYSRIPLVPPYWIKPIKSFRSFLAFRINDERDYRRALPQLRSKISYVSDPFNYLFQQFSLPYEIGRMRESCIAESVLSGSMCTVEGYVFRGDVVIYGVVDSVREQDRSSFSRYEYPSSLPQEVQFRMADISRRVISGIGLDDSPFNIEFFWDQTFNAIGLLEINPRISQAHGDLFEKVHGVPHHSIMLDVALGRKPTPLEYTGPFQRAAHFMLRTFSDGVVKAVPSADDIERVVAELPGTEVQVKVKPGDRLGQLHGQDSYSFELAVIYLGGRDQRELLERYQRCLELLPFELDSRPSRFRARAGVA